MPRHELQRLEFHWREGNFLASAGYVHSHEIHGDIFENINLFSTGPRRKSYHRTDARHQFPRLKGLRDAIPGPYLEQQNLPDAWSSNRVLSRQYGLTFD
jgi:hypothetical protein